MARVATARLFLCEWYFPLSKEQSAVVVSLKEKEYRE